LETVGSATARFGNRALLVAALWILGAPARAGDAPVAEPAGEAPAAAERFDLRREFESETRVRIDVEYPPEGAVVADSTCGVFVAGRALAAHGDGDRFEVVIVLDTSRSTVEPAGADIDGDGTIGQAVLEAVGGDYDVSCTDPGDSILAAEVAGARGLLHGLDSRSVRVALVTFAGDALEDQRWILPRRPATTREPLTADFARIERALDAVAAQEPQGSTHMAAGLDQARAELAGRGGAGGPPDSDSRKFIFFFTDGRPTLPHGPEREADNVREVFAAADRAREAGIRIDSFAIGREALEGPIAAVEMALRTHGQFTPVRHPGDLVELVGEVSFANLEEVRLRSLTTGQPAAAFRETADGSWAGFVHTKPGANEVEVVGRASDGTEGRRTLRFSSAQEGLAPAVPADLVVAHNRLLEACLLRVKEVRLEAEREQAERVRKQLLEEIASERARAGELAAEQRKRLELEVGEETDSSSR
jgi:hypothetical protein